MVLPYDMEDKEMGIKNTIRKAVDTARDLLDDGKINGSIYNKPGEETAAETSSADEPQDITEEESTTTVRGAEVLEDGSFRFSFGSGQPVKYREPEFGLEIGVNFDGTAVARAKDSASVPVDDAKAIILDGISSIICKEPVRVADLPAMSRSISEKISRCFSGSMIELTQLKLNSICPDTASRELLEQKRRELGSVGV